MDSRKLPLVSVLIPTYNRPEYLEYAVNSVLQQTYKNIEIIICDNSDNNKSELMMHKMMSSHKNIRYYKNHENIGGIENVLKCYQLSTGELVNFLMDDDAFHIEKLSLMVPYFIDYQDVALVTSNKQYIGEKGDYLKDEWIIKLSNSPTLFDGKELSAFFVTNLLNVIGEPTTPLFRKASLDGMFGYYKGRTYTHCIDNASWLNILSNGKVAYIPNKLSYCRLHANQAQNSIDSKVLEVKDWYHIINDSYEGDLISKDQYKIALIKYIEKFTPYLDLFTESKRISLQFQLNIITTYLIHSVNKYNEMQK